MNFNHSLNLEEAELMDKLQAIGQQIHPNPVFKAELEAQLRAAHRPRSEFRISRRDVIQFAGWVVALIVLGFVFSWIIRSLVPVPQPVVSSPATVTVTPGAPLGTPTPTGTVEYTVKDGDSCAKIAYDFGITVEELYALNDLGPGCSKITVGQKLRIPIHGTVPTPQGDSYNWNGTALYLNAPLPNTPSEAFVFIAQPDQPATLASALAIAQRFGINGQVYQAPGDLPGLTGFMVTDGKQRIYLHSENYFTYYADYGRPLLGFQGLEDAQAKAIIDSFLKSHGFSFAYQLEHAPQIRGEYYVIPLTPDGFPIRYDYNLPARLEFTLDDNGQVLSVNSNHSTYIPAGGTYGIISAQEAFQKILNNAPIGVEQSMRSGGMLNEQMWIRQYPDHETVTLYGSVQAYQPAEAGQPTLFTIHDYTLTGNTTGLETVQEGVFVEASGQFVTEDGIHTFRVDKWQYTSALSTTLTGTFQKDGGQVYFVIADANNPNAALPPRYLIPDPPADLPFGIDPSTQIMLSGVSPLNGNSFEWTTIQYFPAGSNGGGGGGGGGNGFYRLNLTGTPIPFLTSTPTARPAGGGGGGTETLTPPGVNPPFDKSRVDELRGMLNISIRKKTDGSQVTEYNLIGKDNIGQYFNTQLLGSNLQGLLQYQGLPLIVWGTVTTRDPLTINVERFEVPFPDLQFQILKGTQKTENVSGQTATLFTTDSGQSYVQLTPNGDIDPTIIGRLGDVIEQEVLIVPDETFGGRPTMRVYSGSIIQADSPGLTVTANQPSTYDDSVNIPPNNNIPPTMTIEKVELVYYTSDPRYVIPDPNAAPPYIQPMWRFFGHSSNGDEFEFLVQALKNEFLSPEIQTVQPPG